MDRLPLPGSRPTLPSLRSQVGEYLPEPDPRKLYQLSHAPDSFHSHRRQSITSLSISPGRRSSFSRPPLTDDRSLSSTSLGSYGSTSSSGPHPSSSMHSASGSYANGASQPSMNATRSTCVTSSFAPMWLHFLVNPDTCSFLDELVLCLPLERGIPRICGISYVDSPLNHTRDAPHCDPFHLSQCTACDPPIMTLLRGHWILWICSVSVACTNCRSAHLACSETRPCRRCVQTGRSATCIDVEVSRISVQLLLLSHPWVHRVTWRLSEWPGNISNPCHRLHNSLMWRNGWYSS